jgi:hypothetical protein
MKIENYCLNLAAINTLDDKQKEVIHSYYKDMLYAYGDNRKEMCLSIFNTLMFGGYIIDVRDKKITNILDGTES